MRNIINQRLDIMFTTLREKEKREKGKLCEMLEPIDEYAILMNRRFKFEREIELTDLEKAVAKEEGRNVVMYIAELYYQLKMDQKEEIPFPEYNVSIKDVYQQAKQMKNVKENDRKDIKIYHKKQNTQAS